MNLSDYVKVYDNTLPPEYCNQLIRNFEAYDKKLREFYQNMQKISYTSKVAQFSRFQIEFEEQKLD